MCKRNSPDKDKANTGCVTEYPHIKMKLARDVFEKLPSLKKNKASMGYVREIPQNLKKKKKKKKRRRRKKPAWDV